MNNKGHLFIRKSKPMNKGGMSYPKYTMKIIDVKTGIIRII